MAEIRESKLIRDVLHVEPEFHIDPRGRFTETYRRSWFPLGREMIQANVSNKSRGSVVGLHYHLYQADYWYPLSGHVRVVLHDLRIDSPSEGATELIDFSSEHEEGVFIPPGVAHGFAALTDVTLIYSVDAYYNPEDELGVAWDDPEIAADWGLEHPVISDRDGRNPRRSEIADRLLPRLGLRT